MRARVSIGLLIACCALAGTGIADSGQSHPQPAPSALLAIDEAAFEIAAETGGFYYFWQPGEFARVAVENPNLLVSSGRLIEQIDGELHGTIEIPFEVQAGDARIDVRVGLQSLGEIALFAPRQRAAYDGDATTRTAHMLFVDAADPPVGTWTLRLIGEGRYMIHVTAERARQSEEVSESSRAQPDDPEGGDGDLAAFRRASPDERWRTFRRLPKSRSEALARALLDDPDPRVAYIAAGWLARQGNLDEAVPVYARILVRGENESALGGRMGYDWIHDDDDTLAVRILEALGRYLKDHLDAYPASERARAEVFLRQRGENRAP